ncbi:glycosyl hydrolase 115 family protein [Lentzea aerocolonigenes]|uniref:glycosyl hydrolase 115 family protein n=1 Tax=Lentzea aerocolonigenes TaxID=68170 RepID=UPI0004C40DB8|nr:glycosyl hydrolase 115 family protein [Lentzea aerocolonigenes]MCP2246009.1 Glycosyl hydrolase family 115 [Lentzea aerocolonigenes]
MTSPLARRNFLQLLAALTAGASVTGTASAAGLVSEQGGSARFPLVSKRRAAPIVVSTTDHPGVVRVAADLQADVERVTGIRPQLVNALPADGDAVLVGTLGSPLVDELDLDVAGVAGKWETSLTQVVRAGRRRLLLLTGSDPRGTIYGTYDLSRSIGVSPWYWWDDVPVEHRDELHVSPDRHSLGTPFVKYRGIFINDENPALGTWAPRYFGPGHAPGHPGGFNHLFWEKVFETVLRLKGNYVWPAVWGRAFAEDDPLNHATAKRYGIVMGTSHEAPMMRGIEEWNRHAKPGQDPYGGTGEWSFRRNPEAIKAYWADGIKRMVDEDFEGVVTVGMRGNGDTGLPDGDSIELMQSILAAEQEVLARVTGRDPAEIPQVWTLYKEVLRYWDKGLRPPDHVTVVFPDDNWGNLCKLPDQSLPPRAGGYGLYYHFDYVGGGRNYKWVDTAALANVWEQLDQAAEYGVSRLWVANVGDFKGNELPAQFFFDQAWKPMPLERLPQWEREYAAQNFGSRCAADIAEVLSTYGKLQARRKPELLNRRITVEGTAILYDDKQTPFSLVHHGELDRVTEEWRELGERAERIASRLPSHYQDAFFELVLYQVKATANLYELRRAEFTNIFYAKQGRTLANDLAATAEARFADDLALAERFNTLVAGGKWRGFQTQPHIGYGDVERYGPNAPWQQPEKDNVALPDEIFPPVQRITVPEGAEMGVAIDGSEQWWPSSSDTPVLPEFSPFQSRPGQFVDVFNRGREPFACTIHAGVPWLVVRPGSGRVEKQLRATVEVDWARAPRGTTRVPIVVSGAGRTVTVEAVVRNPDVPRSWRSGFMEASGYVSVEAEHASANVAANGVRWRRIPGIGRTGAGMKPFPVTAASREPGRGPRLEYRMTLFTPGEVTVWAHLSPRAGVLPTPGLRYAVSFDDAAPQVVDIIKTSGADHSLMNRQWERMTSDNVNLTATKHVLTAGPHVLKFWMVDPTVVVQKLVVDTGGLRPSYLGPPESKRM